MRMRLPLALLLSSAAALNVRARPRLAHRVSLNAAAEGGGADADAAGATTAAAGATAASVRVASKPSRSQAIKLNKRIVDARKASIFSMD